MAEQINRRDAMKLLSAIAGGALGASHAGDTAAPMLPGGGGGPHPEPASPGEYALFHAESFDDVESVGRPALVLVSGTDYGIVEVTPNA